MMRAMVADDKSVDPASANWTINERFATIVQGKTAMALNWVPPLAAPRTRPAHWSSARSIRSIAKGAAESGRDVRLPGFRYQHPLRKQGSRLAVPAVAHGQRAAAGDHGRDRRRLPVTRTSRMPVSSMAAGIVEQIPIVRDFWNIPERSCSILCRRSSISATSVARRRKRRWTTRRSSSRRSTTAARTSRPTRRRRRLDGGADIDAARAQVLGLRVHDDAVLVRGGCGDLSRRRGAGIGIVEANRPRGRTTRCGNSYARTGCGDNLHPRHAVDPAAAPDQARQRSRSPCGVDCGQCAASPGWVRRRW